MYEFLSKFKDVRSHMFRVKSVENDISNSGLERCLNATDLTLLAIGGIVGAGIYVMTGIAIKEMAGFLIIY